MIGFSVVPFFSTNTSLLLVVTLAMLLFKIFNSRVIIEKQFNWIFLALIFMYVGQFLVLGFDIYDYKSIFGTFIRFLFPYLIFQIIGKIFFKIFLKIVYCLTIIGLLIWFLEHIFPGLSTFIRDISYSLGLDPLSNENILIYNSEGHKTYGFIRNAGFAYEAGSYSIVLIISLIIHLIINNNKIDKKFIVFVIGLLTTFSTAGYIGLMLILFIFNYNKIKNRIILFFLTTAIIFIAFYSFYSLSFLEQKVASQFELVYDQYETRGRFASAYADFIEWQRSPFFGVGKFDETRFQIFKEDKEQHRVNGLGSFLAKFGLVVFFCYWFVIFRSVKYLVNKNSLRAINTFGVLFILITMAFSQTCLQWPIYIMFMYFPLLYIDE